MLIQFITLLTFAFSIAIISVVYTLILPFEKIGNKWYNFLKWITKENPYFFKPLADCGKCFAGQVALWGYLVAFTKWHFMEHLPLFHVEHFERWGHSYHISGHIFLICSSILLSDLLSKLYNKL